MARYFFDIHDGNAFFRDPEGTECSGKEDVRIEAMRSLPEIARQFIPSRSADAQAFTVLVRDETGTMIYTATLTFAGLWMNEANSTDPSTS
ncbi:hypothetical protein ASF58_20805 [Methylobacterium sp. Leaf125]|nr:hypothetical protein [Methylobacterium sp. Leaf125]KQQ44640.1 hypothetical protein ASF58_20805 [Methylobacterium sp. Leaf125]